MMQFYEAKIYPLSEGQADVIVECDRGRLRTGPLTYDEAIGLLAQLLMPDNPRSLALLRPEHKHKA